MRLLLRASLHYYLHHPWQLVIAVFGVALGVAVVAAVEVASGSAQRAFQLSMDTVTCEATHQIVGATAGLDEGIYRRLRLAGIRETAPLVEAYGVARGETLHLLGVDPFAEGPFRGHLERVQGDGSGTLIARPGSAYLAAPTAARLGVGAGDTLEFELGGRTHRLAILGVIDAGDGGAAAIDGLLLTDIATAQELTGMEGHLSWIDVRLPPGAEGEARLRAIEALLPPSAALLPAESRTLALRQMSGAFHTNLRAMSLLALVVGMFLIYNTMSFAVVQRRSHIACQRLIGVTRGEVLRVVLAEALLIGAAATLLGLGAGIALGQALLVLVAQTVNDLYFVLAVTELRVTPELLLRGALLGLAATLAAALVPALEAASVAPRAALHRSVIEAKSRVLMPRLAAAGAGAAVFALVLLGGSERSLAAGFAGLFLVILGMAFLTPLCAAVLARGAEALLAPAAGVAGRLAVRGITASLSRTGVALAALMLAVATTVGVGLMIESFRGTVAQWLEASLQADIYVSAPGFGSRRSAGALDDALIERVLAVPGVAAHSTGRTLSLESADGFVQIFVLGLSPGLTPRYPLKSGTPAEVWARFRAGEGVVISEPFAFHHRLSAGDSLTLRTDRGARRFPIAGIYYDYSTGQGQVLVPRALYERWFDDHGIAGLGLYLAAGAGLDEALRAVRAAVAAGEDARAVQVRSNSELRRLSLDVFDRTFTITEVLRLLAIAVAVAGILGAMMALQLERGAELAVLRALGLTPGQVFGTVALQTGIMGAIAGLIALPTGLALAVLLIEVINVRSFGWSMELLVRPGVLLSGLGAAIAAALIAGLYPAWKMSRVSPAAALRDE